MHENHEDNEQEWPELTAMKGHVDEITIPSEVKLAVANGMSLGRKRKRRRMMARITTFSACLLVLASVASVRFSPVVAAYVGDIPGLRSLVQLINSDKGLTLALENNYMQPVGLSDEHDGIKLTVDGFLADESRVIVFYTLYNMDGRKQAVNLQEVKLMNNEETSVAFGSSYFNEDWESKQGTIDFNIHEGADIPDTLDLELKVGKDRETAGNGPVWKYVIPVDKSKFEGLKETYDINETVSIEGQCITFGTMTVYPTRIGLEVTYDPSNTKELFAFDDIRIEDEQGETFGTINNGISATLIDENRQVLYFQSNYFRQPNQLYLRANSIRALDKSKLEVLVDLDRKELLSQPDDRLTFDQAGITQKDGHNTLTFHLKNDDPLDENRTYSLFENSYSDATGQLYDSNGSGGTSDGNVYQYIKKADYQSPLKLTISDYPSRIHGDINLRIK
ncbi:DUF4179 domain-containing protein [Paenibacillus anaericanus]|uniref:DUF4179 domain-containing protein n=1 Tax=Paenibacillus anaericanus TaxID=170367 RepID=A0A3S1ELC8_9BACL|nr:DUF4179 domain-containing protein [Paenibacillus anaericanus]RUT48033.1 DUF4179 domain-containing protein [Paenibacillus anaericanus]